MSARNPMTRRAQRGLSIIELMVGIVVAMLVGLAAAGSAIVFTAAQRQGIGAGTTGLSSATALAAVKNELALGGLGFFGDFPIAANSAYQCQNLALSVDAGVLIDGSAFAPVQITAEATGDDRVDVVYAERVESGANVRLTADSDGSEARLRSLLPVQAGQSVVLTRADGTGTCLVRTVTQVTASTTDTPQILTFAGDGTHNKAAFSVAPITFRENDQVALLGDINWSRYRRIGNTLVLERPIDNTNAVIARDVIGLRAQYGLAAAAAGSTTLETWQNATGAFAAMNAATLPRVRAIRLGVVTRSPQREKPDAGGNCEASLTKPTLFGVTVEPDVADWRCYRYQTAIVVVPLRNVVMGMNRPNL